MTQRDRAQRGFSMFITIMALTVTAMFVAAAFAAVNGDLPQSSGNKNRKASYAAAESGLAYYLNHLQQNPDYWTLCDKAPDPNATEKSPVNQQWDGTDPTKDPRTWRTVPGGATQYTIEMLHSSGYDGCKTTDQKSIIDEAAGTFKVRFTGRPSPASTIRRSIVATFRRDSFLNFVYFTDYEDFDPNAITDATDKQRSLSKCAERYRAARASTTATGCPYKFEITFPDGDKVNGPLHTNDDSLMVCGSPSFGRAKTIDGDTVDPPTDTVEVRGGGTTGYISRQTISNPPGQYGAGYSGCTADPTINTPTHAVTLNAKYLGMPQSNQQLADLAKNNGKYYTGKTIIRLNGTTMDVTSYATGSAVTSTSVSWPNNGVLYVDNGTTACTPDLPTSADYDESNSCGNVYVSGSYAKPLTIASRGDIIIKPTIGAKLANNSTDGSVVATTGSDATLGLIADNYVRVGHRVRSCENYAAPGEPIVTNVRIEAAILSLKHSFFADNYDCGDKLGKLTVVGAIAQHYRGTVSTFNSSGVVSGFTKDYWYDDRFRYRSPPYFLSPIDSAWDVVRVHEQVPAY